MPACGRWIRSKPTTLRTIASGRGDAVSGISTRAGADFSQHQMGKGGRPLLLTGYKNDQIQGRFCLRPGYLDAIASSASRLPRERRSRGPKSSSNSPGPISPDFKPALGEVIALDAELCYSDGGPRVYRSFAFGSPLSVQQPASLGKVQLVEKLDPPIGSSAAR